MLLKLGANITNLCPELREKLYEIDRVFHLFTDREAVITSGNDGQHMQNSLHYADRAIDLRTWFIPTKTRKLLVNELKDRLGKNFDVVDEGNHIHIEYDPK